MLSGGLAVKKKRSSESGEVPARENFREAFVFEKHFMMRGAREALERGE